MVGMGTPLCARVWHIANIYTLDICSPANSSNACANCTTLNMLMPNAIDDTLKHNNNIKLTPAHKNCKLHNQHT